jgi:hypothetical protein
LICPNCGASNSTRATFCRRCHQRLPVAGLAAGVTYPRRRNVASGGGRLPIIAALVLAASGIVVGAILVGLSRPSSAPGTFVAGASSTPGSSLPIFVQPTPTPTPPVLTSFPSLPTPFPSTIVPTDTPLITPGPSDQPTPPPPTPTPITTPKPTPRPTPKPTPTPAPIALTCASATGNPTDSVFVGTGNNDKTSKGWCLESATFRIVDGSAWGTAHLLLNGKSIADFSCTNPPTPCAGDNPIAISATKLARPGAVLSWSSTGCVDSTGTPCTDPNQFMATIEVFYELATPQ